MHKKYFAWSFDDGLEQDKRIVEILRAHGMGATFHLNSGLFGDKTYVGRIGDLGIKEEPADSFDPTRRHALSYVEHFRIPADEVLDVYRGFEIAAHTVTHANLLNCSAAERTRQIVDDVRALSQMFGQDVTGFAYPYGVGAEQSRAALEAAGVRYARLATSKPGFRFPEDPLAMPLTCRFVSKDAFDLLDRFFYEEPGDDDLFFLMFAHGYEFDFGTEHANWERFETICDLVAAHDDVICCSIGEAFDRHAQAQRPDDGNAANGAAADGRPRVSLQSGSERKQPAELLDHEKDHLARIRAGLAECMVLLRKDGKFPLDGPCKLAAYGNGVRHGVKGGTGSGDVNAHVVIGIEQGLIDAGFELASTAWLDAYDARRTEAKKDFRKQLKREAKAAGDNVIAYALGAVMPEPEYDIPLDFTADAAIYVLSRTAGEGSDRKPTAGDVLLTETETRDILALSAQYERFMLVLNTGGPVDLSPVSEVGNILVLSQLGSEMGAAFADVLLGHANPSGKLATTWSAWDDYCPDIEIGGVDDTFYREGVYVGYRYFDTVGKRALFPFGFGLSYTEFSLGQAEASIEGGTVRLEVAVTNCGDHAGKEVVQVYVTAPEGELRKPWQELAAFAKTELLEPGATETLSLSFDLADCASFHEEACAYVLEAGEYVVRVGTSNANATPAAAVALERGVVVRTARRLVAPAGFDERVYERAARAEELAGLPRLVVDPMSLAIPEAAYDSKPEIDPAVSALTDEELAYASVGHFSGKGGLLAVIGNASTHVAGAAGETTSRLADKGFAPIVMADGPAGLRLAREFYRDESGAAHALGGGSIPEGVLDVLSAPVRALATKLLSGKKPPRGARIETQFCTALPVGTAIAQSWNLDFAQTCGDVVGAEMERFGVDLWLAPALNIHRSILCGRNFEYFSEDPLVSGKMAAALTRGVQAHPGRGVTIKHFAANNQETNRYFNNSQVSERTLREIYLRGFAICVRESSPHAVMTSYNLVNGVHTSERRELTEGFLRAECEFDGIVMTDWVLPLKNRGTRYDRARAGRVAAAGGDLFMPGSQADVDDILEALAAGRLTRRQLEINATHVYRMAQK